MRAKYVEMVLLRKHLNILVSKSRLPDHSLLDVKIIASILLSRDGQEVRAGCAGRYTGMSVT